MEDYAASKSILFRNCKTAVVNVDDESAETILTGHTCKVVSYAINNNADLKAQNIEFIKENGKLGMKFNTVGAVDYDFTVYTPGMFSVYNSLVTIYICNLLGVNNAAIAKGLEIKQMIKSPTYTIVREYEGRLPLYHLDVYRIGDDPDSIDLDDFLFGNGVTVIEWGELLSDVLPDDYLEIKLEHQGEGRAITLESKGNRSHDLKGIIEDGWR
jgi:tRNA threonylcarbamoyladenosine biosynthesis protein TsaE